MSAYPEELRAAALDPVAQEARRGAAVALADALERAGRLLHVTGWMIGDDRKSGRSPRGNGDDATVACALVALSAGSLCRGAIAMLDSGNPYAVGALTRQLVEIDYLVWCFATDSEAPATWLRSSDSDRQKHWRPASLRKRAGKAFGPKEYWSHCELGGHLTPVRSFWLLDPTDLSSATIWPDLVAHASHIWEGLAQAASSTPLKLDMQEYLDHEPAIDLTGALTRWRAEDTFPAQYAASWRRPIDD